MKKVWNNLALYKKFPEYRKREMEWFKKYDPQAPKPGDQAFDFELTDVSGESRIRLSDFSGEKPVALIFGSFT